MKQAEANAFLQQGDVASAVLLWNQCATEGAAVDEIVGWVAQLHALHCSGACEELIVALLTHKGGSAQDFLGVAKLYFLLARFEIAASLTSCALSREPDNPDISTMLASCWERAGQKERASELLDGLLRDHPSHARAIRLRSHILRSGGDFSAAGDCLTQHLQKYPSGDDWRLRYELAAIWDRLGEYELAMDTLNRAKAQLAPKVPRVQSMKLRQRQWEVTQQIDVRRFSEWQKPTEALTPKQKVCFLAGFPRSGTTLLESVLSSHDCCIGTDETGILWNLFTNPLVIQARSAESAMEELDDFYPEELSAGRAEFLRCTEDYIGERAGERWLIEKEPLLTANLAVPLRLFPESKVLIPLRDPRDVIISYLFTIVPLNADSAGAADIESACQFYADTMRHWLYLREILAPEQWMELRYEDLIGDAEKQTKRLASFLGVEWSAALLSHHQKSDSHRQVSTPTYDDVSKPLYTRSLNRWKNYERYLEPHIEMLRPFLNAFGYT